MRGPGDGRIARQESQRRKQAEGARSGLLGKAAYSVAKGLGYRGQGRVTGPRGIGPTVTRAPFRVSARLKGEVGKLCYR